MPVILAGGVCCRHSWMDNAEVLPKETGGAAPSGAVAGGLPAGGGSAEWAPQRSGKAAPEETMPGTEPRKRVLSSPP